MYLKDFNYLRPKSLKEACEMLQNSNDGALIAGGTDLLVEMKMGLRHHEDIISLADVDELKKIEDGGDHIIIGSGANHSSIVNSSLLKENYSALSDASSNVGTEQVRNSGTVGGNICTGASCCDTGPDLVASDCILEITDGNESREISVNGAFGQRGVFGTRERPTAELAPGLDVLGACFPEANPRGTVRGDGPLLVDGVVDLVKTYRSAGRQLAVFAHWGEEQIGLASPRQRSWARALVADGAAQVVGCHAHVTGAGEDIGDASVIYSLGNFLFRAMQGGGTRSLGSNRRSAAAGYEWEGERLRYERRMDCRFDECLNLTIREGAGRFPGGWWERFQLASPEAFGARLYAAALATRGLRVGATKVMTGVERPSLTKLGTAARLLLHRQD